jgi:hypothetical protein
MTPEDSWYVEQRAQSMAVVLLTRLPYVRVEQGTSAHRGVDFLVTLNGRPGRHFGVELKATRDLSSIVDQEGILAKGMAANARRTIGECSFPVGVLVVDVVDDTLRFGWVRKPELGKRLSTAKTVQTEPATRSFMISVVEEVDKWYGAKA